MGKRIRAQKLGRTPRRRSPGHRFRGGAAHPRETGQRLIGKVLNIIHDPARTAPLAEVCFGNKEKLYVIAPLGLSVGQKIACGKSELKEGNVLSVGDVPEGTLVYNVEAAPGDSGRFARAGGTYCRIISHDQRGTIVQLPSGAFKTLNSKCRASVGIVSGAGRKEKPFVKAGPKWHAMHARNKLYPIVKGVNMNPVDHPFGGGAHPHIGRPKTVSRNAPPGRKVGSIAAKRTGRKR